MIIVTGKTFEHRDTLKQLRGRFTNNRWEFDYLTKENIERLKSLTGCIVTNTNSFASGGTYKPATLDDAIDTFINAFHSIGSLENNSASVISNCTTAIYGNDERYFNYFKDKNPRAFFGFSSLFDMIEYIEKIPAHMRENGWERDNEYFTATPSMDAAIQLARNGWSEGIDTARELADMLTADHAQQRKRLYGPAGGSVSVGRMLAGNPAHMSSRPKQPGRKIITLFIENSVNHNVDTKSISIRAAVVAAIVDLIETQGYSCEIVAVDTSLHQRKPGAHIAVTIKQAGEKLSLNDTIFALGHPSFLRRFCFALVCSSNECQNFWDTQGSATVSFNDKYATGRNEFYFTSPNSVKKYETLRDKAIAMFKQIAPAGLPVQIEE